MPNSEDQNAGLPEPRVRGAMASPLDSFIPVYDIRERHGMKIEAPPDLVFDLAAGFDPQSLPLVRAIFWLRGVALGSTQTPVKESEGFLSDMRRLGWGVLAEEPKRLFVAGASCQPWLADVVFTTRTAGDFRAFAEPGFVKIAWTLEVTPRGRASCLLATETRAIATDETARRLFRRYWRRISIGVRAIRWLILLAMRRQAEARYRAAFRARAHGSALLP
jgi:hypothetical protein